MLLYLLSLLCKGPSHPTIWYLDHSGANKLVFVTNNSVCVWNFVSVNEKYHSTLLQQISVQKKSSIGWALYKRIKFRGTRLKSTSLFRERNSKSMGASGSQKLLLMSRRKNLLMPKWVSDYSVQGANAVAGKSFTSPMLISKNRQSDQKHRNHISFGTDYDFRYRRWYRYHKVSALVQSLQGHIFIPDTCFLVVGGSLVDPSAPISRSAGS